jgi:hypothetical protein
MICPQKDRWARTASVQGQSDIEANAQHTQRRAADGKQLGARSVAKSGACRNTGFRRRRRCQVEGRAAIVQPLWQGGSRRLRRRLPLAARSAAAGAAAGATATRCVPRSVTRCRTPILGPWQAARGISGGIQAERQTCDDEPPHVGTHWGSALLIISALPGFILNLKK